VLGYRPRDEQVYIIFNEPGRMLGRFALHEDRTLFLFVFTAGEGSARTDLPVQKALLRARYGDGQWECPRILDELDHAQDLYFDRVSQIRMNTWSEGRVALVGDAAFCVSSMAGQGSALGMTAAYVLAKAQGQQDEAFRTYETLLRGFMASKQSGAARLSAAFAPKTQSGLFFRNQVIKASAIPGVAKLALAAKSRIPCGSPNIPGMRFSLRACCGDGWRSSFFTIRRVSRHVRVAARPSLGQVLAARGCETKLEKISGYYCIAVAGLRRSFAKGSKASAEARRWSIEPGREQAKSKLIVLHATSRLRCRA
jgi:hypothetical protein